MSHAEPTVLIVDDERVNVDLMVDLLKPQYRTLVATNGERVKAHLENKHARDFIEDRNRVLQGMVIERTRELVATRDATILSMATLAETRDPETGHHLQRTQGYVRALAVRLSAHVRFRDQLDERLIDLLFKSAPLHDIGKVGVPDSILLKPARLTPDEYEASSFLRCAREIARSHHEKWDGSGYPDGLAGDDIPLSARLMALADVYDALISRRCYKPGYSHAEAATEITKGRGQHFDPDVVDAFCEMEADFVQIARSHAE